MSKKTLSSSFTTNLHNISMVVSIVKSFSSDPAGNYWSARILEGIEGTGNTPIQALESVVVELKKAIQEAEEEIKVDNILRNRVAEELFGDRRGITGLEYMKSRSPSDLVTDVVGLIKKIVHEEPASMH